MSGENQADGRDGDSGTGSDTGRANGRDASATGSGPDDGDGVRHERTFRGISLRLAVRYLRNLGGEFRGDDPDDPDQPATVAGDGWTATLTAETASVGPSLSLTEVTVVFEGETAALDGLVEDFAQKAMRAGG